MLYGHDITADSAATPTVDYVSRRFSEYYYAIDSNGKLHQWSDADRTTQLMY